jgi:sialic acid synthase SpsE
MQKIALTTYKIASGEVTNIPMLEAIAQIGNPVLLSSGMSNWEELDLAVRVLKTNGCPHLTILQCTSEYPCMPEHAGLNLLREISSRYDVPVGFSDHTLGVAVPVAAVCLGATVIEKHFTLSKAMYGPDAAFSVTPDELRFLVETIRDAEKSLQHAIDKDAKAQSLGQMKFTFEKSIVAANDLPAGTRLESHHLTCKKPASGIPSRQFYDVVGKTLKNDAPANTCIEWKWLE